VWWPEAQFGRYATEIVNVPFAYLCLNLCFLGGGIQVDLIGHPQPAGVFDLLSHSNHSLIAEIGFGF
jgi:hypothetical protein